MTSLNNYNYSFYSIIRIFKPETNKHAIFSSKDLEALIFLFLIKSVSCALYGRFDG